MTRFEANVREEWPEHGDAIIGLIRGHVNPEDFTSVRTWMDRCYHKPNTHALIACALNEVIEGHGVEAVMDVDGLHAQLEYVNMGDTYATTLVYFRDTWRVASWGDYVERYNLGE